MEPKKFWEGKHLLFWFTLPFLILTAAIPFYAAHAWDLRNIAAAASLGVFCVLLALMIYDAKKFWWAACGVAFLGFLLFAFYLGSQILRGIRAHTWYPDGPKSTISIPNAIKGFLVFGLPCLAYTIFGNKLLNRFKKQ